MSHLFFWKGDVGGQGLGPVHLLNKVPKMSKTVTNACIHQQKKLKHMFMHENQAGPNMPFFTLKGL